MRHSILSACAAILLAGPVLACGGAGPVVAPKSLPVPGGEPLTKHVGITCGSAEVAVATGRVCIDGPFGALVVPVEAIPVCGSDETTPGALCRTDLSRGAIVGLTTASGG